MYFVKQPCEPQAEVLISSRPWVAPGHGSLYGLAHLPIQEPEKQLVDNPKCLSSMMHPKSICMVLPILLNFKKKFQMPPLRTKGQATLRNSAAEDTHATVGHSISFHLGPIMRPGSSVALRFCQKPCFITKQQMHLDSLGWPHPFLTCWIWTGDLHPHTHLGNCIQNYQQTCFTQKVVSHLGVAMPQCCCLCHWGICEHPCHGLQLGKAKAHTLRYPPGTTASEDDTKTHHQVSF